MKNHIGFLSLTFALLLCLAACRPDSTDAVKESPVSEFNIDQKLVSGEKSYWLETDYGIVYLDLSASVQWPEHLGSHDIRALQDSLIAITFADSAAVDLHTAIEDFINHTAFVPDVKSIMIVDSVPSDSIVYFNNVNAAVEELNERYITYNVTSSTYLGGAHPVSTCYPFTYDFASGSLLGLDNIFKPDTDPDAVVEIIRQALARQYDVPVYALDRAGIFSANLTYPGRPYIDDNILYFHYDPYEIAPYSMGMIDVAVYPYDIVDLLRPEVAALFDTGI